MTEILIKNKNSELLTRNCAHEWVKVSDKRYPYKVIRCKKCGYEP